VEAVVQGMVDKFVTKGWKNLKAIHIKGASTMALPIWLTNELWVEEGDVRENDEGNDAKAVEGSKKASKKRKPTNEEEQSRSKFKVSAPDDDTDLIASRKEKLLAQKSKALFDDSNDSGSKAISGLTEGTSIPGRKKRKSESRSQGS